MKYQGTGQVLGWAITLTLSSTGFYPAIAQITPDITLGTESSIVTPNQSINGLPSDLIEGGAIRGVNVFHSFTNFNIQEGRGAYFANPTGVDNIISRVTGNTPSNLLGTLGVLGNANLFFLNPNGIVFGANAQLDVRGSFFASTSDRFRFSDGSEFSAVNPQAPPLLTVNVPLGLQYGTARSRILNEATLSVGKDLTLHGDTISSPGQLVASDGVLTVRSTSGDIHLQHLSAQTATIFSAQNLLLRESQLFTKDGLTLQAQDTVHIHDTIDQPVLLWAGGQLLVQGDRAIDIFALNHPVSHLISGGDMVLRSGTAVGGDAHYWSGRNIRIEQLDGSLGNLFSPYDPIFYATGDVLLNGYNGVSLHIFAGGRVNIPGSVTISGVEPLNNGFAIVELISLQDGSLEQINGYARPTLDIRAGTLASTPPPGYIQGINTPGFPPFPLILPPPPNPNAPATGADITIGSVNILAPNGTVFLSNQYIPNLSLPEGNISVNGFNGLGIRTNLAVGSSGSVTIDSRDRIILNALIDTGTVTGDAGNVRLLARNGIGSFAPINTRSVSGNAGSVTLNSQNGFVVTGAPINTSSSIGNAGAVTLLAGERIEVNRSITTSIGVGSNGSAGNIQMTAPQITVQGAAEISANTFGSGSGGNIRVNAGLFTLQNNAQLASITGDDQRINSAAVSNIGQGGNIAITADSVSLLGQSFIVAQTNQLSSGNAGTVTVKANQMILQDGSYISGVTLGEGRGGVVQLDIADTLNLIGTDTVNTQTGIFLNAFSSGDAGNLEIVNARQVIVQAGALISASASATGQAGNLTINTPSGIIHFTGVSNNPLVGKTASGLVSETRDSARAGDILINARQLLVEDGGQVSAQTIGTGRAGTLAVNASEVVRVTGADGIFASRLFFGTTNTGDAGELRITTPTLQIQNGGQVSARTTGSGFGGIIRITTSTGIEVSGSSGAFTSGLYFDSEGSGNARGIRLNTTGQLTLRDSGQITVSGTGSGFSGTIDISADSIALINQGRIRATTQQSEGGNIFLQLSNPAISIWMANNSEISAEASGFANAGTLTIDAAGAIISRSLADNNDIVANAIFGRGGRIEATATLITGFRQFQGFRTAESDFTSLRLASPASSANLQRTSTGFSTVRSRDSRSNEFPGSIAINTQTPPAFPALPDDFLTDTVAVICQPRTSQANRSEFMIRGTGGVASRPEDAMGSEAIAVGLVAPAVPSGQASRRTRSKIAPPPEIVEAQQVVQLPDSTIALVASSGTAGLSIPGCQTP